LPRKLGAATKYSGRARPASCYRDCCWCFQGLIEAIIEGIIGRDISYTYVPGPDHRSRRGAVGRPETRAARGGRRSRHSLNEGIEETKMKKDHKPILAMTLGLAFAGAGPRPAEKPCRSETGGPPAASYYPLGGAVANVAVKEPSQRAGHRRGSPAASV